MKKGLWKYLILLALLALLAFLGTSNLDMPGADEKVNSVAAGYAAEVGAGERPPYINTGKGDLLLFVFALGGASAGFWLGYAWRDLFNKRESRADTHGNTGPAGRGPGLPEDL